MTTPPPVPAAPASLDPLLMPRRASGPPLLGAPVSELRVLVLDEVLIESVVPLDG